MCAQKYQKSGWPLTRKEHCRGEEDDRDGMFFPSNHLAIYLRTGEGGCQRAAAAEYWEIFHLSDKFMQLWSMRNRSARLGSSNAALLSQPIATDPEPETGVPARERGWRERAREKRKPNHRRNQSDAEND